MKEVLAYVVFCSIMGLVTMLIGVLAIQFLPWMAVYFMSIILCVFQVVVFERFVKQSSENGRARK